MPGPARVVPGVPAPSLAGRIGSAPLRARGEVRYLPLAARSLVGRCSSPRMPFDRTVNPYRGCAMGCRYCYAAYTHEFMGLSGTDDFHSTVFVKQGGWQATAQALAAAVRRGELVALGTATDPYQPGEAEWRVTRRFLEIAAQFRGLRLGITTKGAVLLRDLDLLSRIAARGSLSVYVSLMSLDGALLKRLEPWAPPPLVRVEMLRRLAAAGIDVGLAIAPVLPGLTDGARELDALLRAAREAGVRHVRYNLLFLRSPTREKYLDFLRAEFPRLLEAHERAYEGRVYLRGAYARRVRATLAALARKHGYATAAEDSGGDAAPAQQLALWAPV